MKIGVILLATLSVAACSTSRTYHSPYQNSPPKFETTINVVDSRPSKFVQLVNFVQNNWDASNPRETKVLVQVAEKLTKEAGLSRTCKGKCFLTYGSKKITFTKTDITIECKDGSYTKVYDPKDAIRFVYS